MPITRKTAGGAARGGPSRPGRPAPAAARPPARAGARPAAPAPGGAFMSLDPSTYVQGGLLDDIDVTFSSVRFCEWDYNGATDEKTGDPIITLALLVAMEYDDNGKAASADQYYSAGDLSRFQPDEDGTHAVAVGNAKGMSDSTNAARLIKSIIDAGFPPDRFGDGDVSCLDGLVAHINRVPQERGGSLKGKKNSAGYDPTVAVVTQIIQMPWEGQPTQTARPMASGGTRPPARPAAPTGRTAAGARTRPAPAAAASPSDGEPSEFTEEAAGILLAVLDAKQGTVARNGIAAGAFKPLTGNANRPAILALITNDDWLYENGENYGWSFDGKTVSAG